MRRNQRHLRASLHSIDAATALRQEVQNPYGLAVNEVVPDHCVGHLGHGRLASEIAFRRVPRPALPAELVARAERYRPNARLQREPGAWPDPWVAPNYTSTVNDPDAVSASVSLVESTPLQAHLASLPAACRRALPQDPAAALWEVFPVRLPNGPRSRQACRERRRLRERRSWFSAATSPERHQQQNAQHGSAVHAAIP